MGLTFVGHPLAGQNHMDAGHFQERSPRTPLMTDTMAFRDGLFPYESDAEYERRTPTYYAPGTRSRALE